MVTEFLASVSRVDNPTNTKFQEVVEFDSDLSYSITLFLSLLMGNGGGRGVMGVRFWFLDLPGYTYALRHIHSAEVVPSQTLTLKTSLTLPDPNPFCFSLLLFFFSRPPSIWVPRHALLHPVSQLNKGAGSFGSWPQRWPGGQPSLWTSFWEEYMKINE